MTRRCSLALAVRRISSWRRLLMARKRERRIVQINNQKERGTSMAIPPAITRRKKPAAVMKISRMTICFNLF